MAECEIPSETTLMMIKPSVHIGGLKINGIMFDYGTSMTGSIPNLGTMPAAPLYELVKGTTAPLTIRGYRIIQKFQSKLPVRGATRKS